LAQDFGGIRVRRFDWTQTAGSRLRIALLGAAVVASIWLPAMVGRNAMQESIVASQWVAHSADVRSTMLELLLEARTMQGSVWIAYAGVESVADTERVFRTREKTLVDAFQRLRRLCEDNPDQLGRIGGLQSVVDGRVAHFKDALAALASDDRKAARDILVQGQVLFPYANTAQQIIDVEAKLYDERERTAAASRERGRWISFGATALQLLLLAFLIALSEQQMHRRLQAEQSSRRAVASAQRVLQSVREPIAVLDRELRLIMANAAFAELYGGGEPAASAAEQGMDAGDSLATRALASIGEDAWSDPALLQRLRDVAARDRELWDYELAQRTADGVDRTVVINACSMTLPEPEGSAILLTVSDVTARKRNEEQVERLNRDLAARVEEVSDINRELEAFSYSVSHDLRAPLRHIAGFSDKLAMRLDGKDETANHYLEVMGESARRMSGLIEGLLVYSRLGRHAMRMQPIDMERLVREVRRSLATRDDGPPIEWTIGPLPPALGDENMLRQVWQNLLDNAIKYTARADPARITVQGRISSAGECVYSVADNGAGFDMEYAANLFGVFQRMHKASEFPGTGIGLANVRRIITRHRGRVWAEAAVGEGATFHFTLPATAGGDLTGVPA
jgi:signal transduction histidine kinase/CHASE3 domain sensor protein